MNSTHPLYHDVVHAHALGAPRVVEDVDPGKGQRQYQGAHIRPPPEHVQDGAHQEKWGLQEAIRDNPAEQESDYEWIISQNLTQPLEPNCLVIHAFQPQCLPKLEK